MKLNKSTTNDSERWMADPPFETTHTVDLTAKGEVSIQLSPEALDILRHEVEWDDDGWFDGIAWEIGLDQLVTVFIDDYTAGDSLQLDDEARADFVTLATALERAAAMLRSTLSSNGDSSPVPAPR